MKSPIVTLVLFLSTFASFAYAADASTPKETNLACYASGAGARNVIVGEDIEMQALLVSSESRETVALTEYAVVIQPLPGGQSKFETLNAEQFSWIAEPSEFGGMIYVFTDFKNGVQYQCDLNIDVHANPALSRSN